jgi:uncharacterized membrane protein YcaP (DUF421 family)
MMLLEQVGLALLFYALVIGMFRLAGKRLAGQTTTFDLLVLISLTVALQQVTLLEGMAPALVFVATVFAAHLGTAKICAHSSVVRHFIRGKPCDLIQNGEILYSALRSENMTLEELKAGLRKLGINDVTKVQSAFLEETGHISAIEMESAHQEPSLDAGTTTWV